MRSKRIVIIGTRTWELTSIHMEYFVKNEAHIVGILESPTEGITTTTSGGSSSKPLNAVAEEQNIPIICGKPKDEGVMDQIREWNPDIIVVIGYQFFLPDEFLAIPPMGVLNFHTSLLPRHCGRHPGFWTIWYGDEQSGMAVHFMDSGLDTGEIAYTSYVPVKDGDTVDSLYDRIWKSDETVVKQLLDDVENSCVPRTPQDKSVYTYNYVPHEKDFELDFRQSAQLLVNRHIVKPGKSYVTLNGTQYPVSSCTAIDEPTTSRNFKLNTPYNCQGNLVYMTPNQWLQIDELIQDDNPCPGLEVARKELGELREIAK
ncbi:MAG: formyltransferase family protein [Akkermansiaceae bacterium]